MIPGVRDSGVWLGTLPEADQCYSGPLVLRINDSTVKDAGNSRLVNSEILADVSKQVVGHSSDDIHGRYVYLEPAVQSKAVVNLPRLF